MYERAAVVTQHAISIRQTFRGQLRVECQAKSLVGLIFTLLIAVAILTCGTEGQRPKELQT